MQRTYYSLEGKETKVEGNSKGSTNYFHNLNVILGINVAKSSGLAFYYTKEEPIYTFTEEENEVAGIWYWYQKDNVSKNSIVFSTDFITD